jgi:hypothetical protein
MATKQSRDRKAEAVALDCFALLAMTVIETLLGPKSYPMTIGQEQAGPPGMLKKLFCDPPLGTKTTDGGRNGIEGAADVTAASLRLW